MKLSERLNAIDIIALFISILLISGFIFLFIMLLLPEPLYRITPYTSDREQIDAAVWEFMGRPTDLSYNHTIGEVPIVNNTVIEVSGWDSIPDKEYSIVAICPLLTSSSPKGILKQVPASVHPRNCLLEGANAELNVTDCSANCTGSYVWLTTTDGDIAAICIGDKCTAHGEDGFQDVYP